MLTHAGKSHNVASCGQFKLSDRGDSQPLTATVALERDLFGLLGFPRLDTISGAQKVSGLAVRGDRESRGFVCEVPVS